MTTVAEATLAFKRPRTRMLSTYSSDAPGRTLETDPGALAFAAPGRLDCKTESVKIIDTTTATTTE